jgi:hypothetical protein
MTGSKQVVHLTSETWWELREIAGSTQREEKRGKEVGNRGRDR